MSSDGARVPGEYFGDKRSGEAGRLKMKQASSRREARRWLTRRGAPVLRMRCRRCGPTHRNNTSRQG